MSFEIPKDIGTLSAEELDAALESAVNEFAPLGKLSNEELDDDQYARMAELGEFAEAANAKKAADAQAFAERNAKIDAIRQTMASKDEEDEGEDEAPAGDSEDTPVETPAEVPPLDEIPAEEVIEEVTPAEEVIAEVAEGELPEDSPLEEIEELPSEQSEEDEDEKEKNAVVASGKSSIAGTAKKAPKTEETGEETKAFSLVAAADIPQISAGTQFNTLKDAGSAISARLNTLPRNAKNTFSRQGALVFTRDSKNVLRQENTRDDLQLLLAAGAEASLKGGSLIAAGGWARPSEQLLDFCAIESNEGLIDLPEVSLQGGVNYTKGPSFDQVLGSDTGFWDMTEAVAEAGSELKTSLRPEVPLFSEVRLDAVGTMVEAGLLTRAGWPELVERYASLALLAHEVKMHLKKIKGIKDFIGASIDIDNGFGNAVDILHVVDVVLAGERQRYSMAPNATIEVLLPSWIRNVFRADLANRNGVDYLSITDAQIDGYFSARNARTQFLSHYQNLDLAAGVATGYPETLEIICYPAGTYVAGTSDVISLDTIYDSVNLKKNDYVHLFIEQGLAVTNPCNEGRSVSIDLRITGQTGAAAIETALFRAPVV